MQSNQKIRLAILGTRGIPGRYGGFETFADEISSRLTNRGYEVTVYCRRFFGDSIEDGGEYKGVKRIFLPTVRHKYFETVLHTIFSFIHLFKSKYDVVLLCNAANSPFAFLVNIRALPLAINVDGIERKRSKWNRLGKWWYRLGELTSVWFGTEIVADAEVIAEYYLTTYQRKTTVIAYGADAIRRNPGPTLISLGVSAKSYILYVSRLEPENNALGVIQAYGYSHARIPLVIVGDAPYANEYKERLKAAAVQIESQNSQKKIVFAGFQFGDAYQELQSNALIYIQATEVGGTHPALVEAMAYGNCVIANGTPENREVLESCGLLYDANNFSKLAELIDQAVEDPDLNNRYREKAQQLANLKYSWDSICSKYDDLFKRMIAK